MVVKLGEQDGHVPQMPSWEEQQNHPPPLQSLSPSSMPVLGTPEQSPAAIALEATAGVTRADSRGSSISAWDCLRVPDISRTAASSHSWNLHSSPTPLPSSPALPQGLSQPPTLIVPTLMNPSTSVKDTHNRLHQM